MGAAFAAALSSGIFTFTLPLMNLDEKASGMWLGSGFAGYFFAKLLIAPISGTFADKFGVKKPLLIATSLAAFLPLIYVFSPEITSLYAIQFALGLCAGTVRTVSMAAIGTSMQGNNLSVRFGHLAAAMNSSFLLGPLLGGFLYLNKDYLPVLGGMSFFMIVAFILFILYSPSKSAPSALSQKEIAPPASTQSYIYIMLALFGRAVGIGSLIAFYPLLIKSSLNLSPAMTAVVYSVPSLITIVLLPILGRLLAEYNRNLITCTGMIISSLGIFCAATSNSYIFFILAGIIMGAGSAVSMPASMAICSDLGSRKGKTIGFANMATNLGFMTGPLFCGIMVSTTGQIGIPLKLAAIAGALLTLPLMHQGIYALGKKKLAHFTAIIVILISSLLIPLQLQHHSTKVSAPDTFRYTDVAMGTVVNLTLITPETHSTKRIAKKAVTLMHKLQRDFDHRNKLGSVGRINHSAGKRGIKTSDNAFHVIKRGLEFSKKSNGNFDITIGAITTTPFYYAFDKSHYEGRKDLINYRLVEIDPTDNIVTLPHKGMAIDLGGLAKGTIIDAAAQFLQNSGIKTGMVEAGGDFMVFGKRLWSIGIRNPRGKGILGYIEVKDSAVCGSGDYYQFIQPISTEEKTRKHHIFDPSRLQSSNECIATTTIAPNAETADALATTVFIMGPDKGTEFLKKQFPACAAMWVLPNMTIRSTDNFPAIKNK